MPDSFVDKDLWALFKCPTPAQAMAAIPLVGSHMLMAWRDGGEAAFVKLKEDYVRRCDVKAPRGSKARLFANMIWNAAEDKARALKVVVKCRGCLQRNRLLASRQKPVCGKCKSPLLIQDAEGQCWPGGGRPGVTPRV